MMLLMVATLVFSGCEKTAPVKEDASKIKFDANIKPKPNKIYHFIGFGYCRYDKDGKFYFAHP